MNEKRLRRSVSNKIIGGLCGGFGEYLNIDPTVIRLVWVLSIFWIGLAAIIAYFVGLIIVSVTEQKEKTNGKDVFDSELQEEKNKRQTHTTPKSHIVWGWLIIGVGVMILLESLGYFSRIKEYIFPGILIIAGVWVLIKGISRHQ
jgi:phage shock protein C